MNLSNIDLLSLQTTQMKNDPITQALCNTLNPQFRTLADDVKNVLIYSRIEELDEFALDELAIEFSMDWYDNNADIDTKRKLIKTALKIHKMRGTPKAVEDIITLYFGRGRVQEWFEYDGKPYMFKVITNNTLVTKTLGDKFNKTLNQVKNVRSHLEEILIQLEYANILELKSSTNKYEVEYPMCGETVCGVEPELVNEGIIKNLYMDLLSKYNLSEYNYSLPGETLAMEGGMTIEDN